MKFNKFFLISIFFLIVTFSSNVLAQYYAPTTQQSGAVAFTSSILSFINSIFKWLFGVEGTGSEVIIYLAMFTILAIFFCDALITFSPLSRKASIAIGMLLTIIATVTGGVRESVQGIMGFTAKFGAWSFMISLLVLFIAYVIFRWIFAIIARIVGIVGATRGTKTVKQAAKGIKAAEKFYEEISKK